MWNNKRREAKLRRMLIQPWLECFSLLKRVIKPLLDIKMSQPNNQNVTLVLKSNLFPICGRRWWRRSKAHSVQTRFYCGESSNKKSTPTTDTATRTITTTKKEATSTKKTPENKSAPYGERCLKEWVDILGYMLIYFLVEIWKRKKSHVHIVNIKVEPAFC